MLDFGIAGHGLLLQRKLLTPPPSASRRLLVIVSVQGRLRLTMQVKAGRPTAVPDSHEFWKE